MMRCPRCDSELRELLPSAVWLRHFVCDDCWSAWHLESARVRAADQTTGVRYWKNESFLAFGRVCRIELEPIFRWSNAGMRYIEVRSDPVLRSALTGKPERLSFRTGT